MSSANRHIAIVTGVFPARSESFVANLGIGLAQRGNRVSVVCGGTGEGIQPEEIRSIESCGVEIHKVSTFGKGRHLNLFRVIGTLIKHPALARFLYGSKSWTRREFFEAMNYREALKRIAPDIVHIQYGAKAAPLLQLGLPMPNLTTWHGYDANEVPMRRGEDVYRTFFSAGYPQTVGSEFMRRRLTTLGARPESIFKVPMGVEIRSPEELNEPRPEAGRLKVISVGRLSEEKGHDTLLYAVERLVGEGLDIYLEIIGDGPMRTCLKEQIENSFCSERFQLLGSLPNQTIRTKLQESDVFAQTGRVSKSGSEESQGLAIIEAQAAGLPVVVCDIGGVSESVRAGKSGILCAPNDTDEISNALRFFYKHPAERRAYGNHGKLFVREKFSIDRMLDQFEYLYENCTEPNVKE